MMTGSRAWRTCLVVLACLLASIGALTLSLGRPQLPFGLLEASHPPPPAASLVSFSIQAGDSTTASGISPADVLIVDPSGGPPIVAISESNLGLQPGDDLSGLAFELSDFYTMPDDLVAGGFSVARLSVGAVGSEVAVEAGCTPAEPHADVFRPAPAGTNVQIADGDGSVCATNIGVGLGLVETSSPDDNLDALAHGPERVDADGDGIPEGLVYLTLTPTSPTLTDISATAGDVLMTVGAATPVVYASAASLGLVAGDVIDSICVDDSNGVFEPAPIDLVLFSLAPGSPSLGTLGASAASVLAPGPVVVVTPGLLGLLAADDIDAGLCPADTDRDLIADVADNCPDVPNTGQENTDAALAAAGATKGAGGPPLPADGLGDACDGDDDNDDWPDTAEAEITTNPLDNCIGAPGSGGDAWPVDFNTDAAVTGADLSATAAVIGLTEPAAPARRDIAPIPDPDDAVTGADLSAVAGRIAHTCS